MHLSLLLPPSHISPFSPSHYPTLLLQITDRTLSPLSLTIFSSHSLNLSHTSLSLPPLSLTPVSPPLTYPTLSPHHIIYSLAPPAHPGFPTLLLTKFSPDSLPISLTPLATSHSPHYFAHSHSSLYLDLIPHHILSPFTHPTFSPPHSPYSLSTLFLHLLNQLSHSSHIP